MFQVDDFVIGQYFGVPFTGVIRSERPHSMAHRRSVLMIDTDQPIESELLYTTGTHICIEVYESGRTDNGDTFIRHDFGYMDYRYQFDHNTYPREALELYPPDVSLIVGWVKPEPRMVLTNVNAISDAQAKQLIDLMNEIKGGTRVPDSLAPNDYDYDWREDRNVYESA